MQIFSNKSERSNHFWSGATFTFFMFTLMCYTERRKENIQNICKVVKGNIHNFDTLMKRADLCNDRWLKDYKDYKKRIKDQIKWMKKEKPKKYPLFLKKQEMLDKTLVKFEKKQNKKNLKQLETSMKAYQKACEKGCK